MAGKATHNPAADMSWTQWRRLSSAAQIFAADWSFCAKEAIAVEPDAPTRAPGNSVVQVVPAGPVDAGQPENEGTGDDRGRSVFQQHLGLPNGGTVGRGPGCLGGFVHHRSPALRINRGTAGIDQGPDRLRRGSSPSQDGLHTHDVGRPVLVGPA